MLKSDHKDIESAIAAIDKTIIRLEWIKGHVVTLHTLAYEADRTGTDKSRVQKTEHYGDETGTLDVRVEWHRLQAWLGLARDGRVHNATHVLSAIASGVERVLTTDRAGRLARPDEEAKHPRGTNQHNGPISQAEFEQALANQRKRGRLTRLVPQPKRAK